MNKAQKAVQKASLNDEKRTIRELKQVYGQAKKDVEERIRNLSARTDMENLQSIIYQKKYQEALKKQLDDVLDKLNTGQFDTISDYLKVCYENGYIGNMYDLHHQGIPMTLPINQKKVVKALQTDTKLSSRKYKGNPLKGRLTEDVDKLKLSIRAELSRSVANGSSWNEVAVKIAKGMNNPFDKAYKNALLIARTEGHRIQQSATLDAMHDAKDHGADVVKQWDSTMDRKTRPAHQEADGQIRELDEPFDVWGEKMDAPAVGGSAKNVCNCRCQLLQRARWAMDEDELKVLQDKANYFGLDKNDSFEDFKQKYNIVLQEEAKFARIRELPNIEFDTKISGMNSANDSVVLKSAGKNALGDDQFEITFDKREKIEWDSLSSEAQFRMKMVSKGDKPFYMDKGTYNIQSYVKGSNEYKQRLDIAKGIDAEYFGTTWYKKHGTLFDIDFYKKDGKIIYSVGKADVKKTLTQKSLSEIKKVSLEREKFILEELKKKKVSVSTITYREGDDWVQSMKEFHKLIDADGLPKVISDEEYKSINSPILYRGIAPQSHLRKDITTNLTTSEMADEFFKSKSPFPSRGVYGDGIAYASPSCGQIAVQYATSGGKIPHGGVIIEFKLKSDAKTITYEDALDIFRQISKDKDSKLLFNSNQRKALDKEVGKAMNALGYDAIIKPNGDNTGQDFYVVLNRGALVTKKKYITKKL